MLRRGLSRSDMYNMNKPRVSLLESVDLRREAKFSIKICFASSFSTKGKNHGSEIIGITNASTEESILLASLWRDRYFATIFSESCNAVFVLVVFCCIAEANLGR